jgi:hypothetical protein
VPVGDYHVSESASSGTSASDYTSSLSCLDTANANAPVTVTSGVLTLAANADVVCTFTNTRKTGKIELTKVLVPSSDSGRFDLSIKAGSSSGTEVGSKASAGNGDTTGEKTVPTGNYHVSEAASTGTTGAGYTSSLACIDTANANAAVTVTNGIVAVGHNMDIVCTFTNKTYVVITLVCQGSSLHSSTVSLDGVEKDSLKPAQLPAGVTAAEACSLGGARYTPVAQGSHTGSVNIPATALP